MSRYWSLLLVSRLAEFHRQQYKLLGQLEMEFARMPLVQASDPSI
jgi:hypothetical protein